MSIVISDQKPPVDSSSEPNKSDSGSSDSSKNRPLELALAAARTAHENRGEDIVILDMREITPVFDYFVVVTGNSRRQLHAISEEIDHCLEDELNDHRMGIEGYRESRWILLDYGNVVIHLFDDEMREFYELEQLWSQAKRVDHPWQTKVEDSSEGNAAASEADSADDEAE